MKQEQGATGIIYWWTNWHKFNCNVNLKEILKN